MKKRDPVSRDVYESLPKVDLHRHLEGSLRIQTLIEIAQKHAITLPLDVMRLNRLVQIQPDENLNIENFLSKFNILRLFYRSPEVIRRITREAVEDAARDHVRYLELRFTPIALSRAERFPVADVMDWVCESASAAARKHKVTVRLIASVNRHEELALAEQVAWVAAARQADGLVGLDLAGDEQRFPAHPFEGLFREARQAGLRLTLHAGEWGGPENVREAIEHFGAERIGHGVRVLEDEFVTALAREHGTAFEVCLTSNYQTGVVPTLPAHPLKQMLSAGLTVTLNTDDPGISQTRLSEEYRLAVESLGMELADLRQSILAAARAAFLPESEREKLSANLRKELYVN